MPQPAKMPVPAELEVPDWVIGRPAELGAIVGAWCAASRDGGITTGLYGAGGFGKTTLARMVCADRRVRRRFGGRVYLVTVGRDVRGAAAIAAKVNDVIKLVAGEDATFTDPQLAGQQLGALLDAGPRRLLVLDDVWEPEQLAPFTEGGKRCARLVTTRVPELLAGRGAAVRVDQMSPEQARALLTSGLPPLDPAVVTGLLAVTGRWPLLLRLVNKILADYAQVGARMCPDRRRCCWNGCARAARRWSMIFSAMPAGDWMWASRSSGPGRCGPRSGPAPACWTARTRSGSPSWAMFAEDETIPFSLVARLWRATAGLDDLRAAQVCQRLAQLALVSQAVGPAGGIAMHDVVRDFLRAELGQQRLAELNGMLLDAVAADLPAASPLDPVLRAPGRGGLVGTGRRGPVPVGPPHRAPAGCRASR